MRTQQGRCCCIALLLLPAVVCFSGALAVTNREYGRLQGFRSGIVEENSGGSRGVIPIQSSGPRWTHRGRIAVTVRRRRPEPPPSRVFKQRSTAVSYVYPVLPPSSGTSLAATPIPVSRSPPGDERPGRWSAYRLSDDGDRPAVLCLQCPSGRSCIPTRCRSSHSKSMSKFPWRGLIQRSEEDPLARSNCSFPKKPEPTIEPPCEALIPPSDGSLLCTHGFTPGSVCNFTCKEGFLVDGPNSSICLLGKWSEQPPICITEKKLPEPPVESCSYPRRPRHGLVFCHGLGVLAAPPPDPSAQNNSLFASDPVPSPSFPAGTLCMYYCAAGYQIPSERTSEATILCLGSAWNETLDLHCQATFCVKPLLIDNGSIRCYEQETSVPKSGRGDQAAVSENYYKGQRCEYRCNSGFAVPSDQKNRIPIQCLAPLWNTTLTPQCKPKLPPVMNCSHEEYFTKATREVNITLPTATVEEGNKTVAVLCTHSANLGPGTYLNKCNSTDPELDTTSSCQYNITVLAVCDAPPLSPANGSIACGPGLTENFVAGTVCHFICKENFTVPTSQKHLVTTQCSESSLWNSSRAPDCFEKAPPVASSSSCQNLTMELTTEEGISLSLPVPKFTTAGERPAEVTCLLYSVSKPGLYENLCTAFDPELGTKSTCSYTAEVTLQKETFVTTEPDYQDEKYPDEVDTSLPCPMPSPPINGQLSCSDWIPQECQLTCDAGHSLQPPGVIHDSKIRCDSATGLWDYQNRAIILPDCLAELPTTLLVAPLHFNVSVPNCDQKQTIDDILLSVREQLAGKNKESCNKIICSNFEHKCHEGTNGIAVLVITWTVQASFVPQDYEYSEEVPEAESMIDKLRSSANQMVTSSPDFKHAVQSLGGILIPESYQQGFFRLVCEKLGYVVDHLSDTCIECPPGTHQLGDECEPCPFDFYQSKSGQSECLPCPKGLITSGNGTRSLEDCLQDPSKTVLSV